MKEEGSKQKWGERYGPASGSMKCWPCSGKRAGRMADLLGQEVVGG